MTRRFSTQQQFAYDNPCQHASQCMNEEYFVTGRQGQYLWSAGLTLNIGEE